MTVLISYSRDHDRVRALVVGLRRHGLRPWRDQDSLDSGDQTEQTIIDELAHCDSAMLWLGGNTLKSEFVRRIEIPHIFESNRRRGMRIVPLFVDLDPTTGADAVRNATGHEIGGHNGHVLDDKPLNTYTTEVAIGEVRAHLRSRFATDTLTPPVVRLVTRTDAAGARGTADLNFNWTSEYPASGDMPDNETVSVLADALHTSVHELLGTYPRGLVQLHLSCHLHLGIALGYELRRVTGAVPAIAVGDDWWKCAASTPPGPDDALIVRRTDGPLDATRSTVEISLTRDVTPLVTDYVKLTGAHYRSRFHLEPQGRAGQVVVTEDLVNPWAEQAAEMIRSARSQPGIEGIDLFISAPIAFAVALGWRLNAIGGIDVFHPQGNSGPYARAWSLRAS